jgi:hypothetical protein
MEITEILALLDHLQPDRVSIHWLLDDCFFIVGEGQKNEERVRFLRGKLSDVTHILEARGYLLTEQDIDPRGGMEGQLIYSR